MADETEASNNPLIDEDGNYRLVLEVNHTLYFAPFEYLKDYLQSQGQMMDDFVRDRVIDHHNLTHADRSDLLTHHKFLQASFERIAHGDLLTEKEIGILNTLTNVSTQTWRNLDATWQQGKLAYVYYAEHLPDIGTFF